MKVSSHAPEVAPSPRVQAARWSLVGIALFYLGLQVAVLPPAGFYSGDQGAKYLQARAFATEGLRHPWIVGPERDLDPDRRFVHAALVTHDGHVVSVFSWFLPLVTAPFLKLFGLRGLYVVPAISALIVFEAARRLGRRLGAGNGLFSGWTALAATPALFYGAEIWEHGPAAASVIVAAALLAADVPATRRRFAAAGAVLSIGVLFREEVAVAAAGMLVARLLVLGPRRHAGPIAAMAAGFVAVAVATLPMNAAVYGTPFPVHTVSELQKGTAYLAIRDQVFHDLLLPVAMKTVFVATVVAAIAAVIFIRALRLRIAAAHAIVAVLVMIGALAPEWRHQVVQVHLIINAGATSLVHVWPFWFVLAYYLLLPRVGVREDVGRFLLFSSLFFIIVASATTPSAGGAQWGPRYLFPAAPLLAIIASATVFRIFRLSRGHAVAVQAVACAVLLLSAAVQVRGLLQLRGAKLGNWRTTAMTEKLTAPGDVIVSDLFWYPQVIETLYGSRRLYFTWSRDEVGEMMNRADRSGLTRVNVVVSVPLTGYEPPATFSTAGRCGSFVRVGRVDMGERALVLHDFRCATAHRP